MAPTNEPIRLVDIPDIEQKEKPTVTLTDDVQAEREVRRYINKEGVFCRDIEQLFAVFTGINSQGKCTYRQTKTRAEAEQIVTELLQKAGRKVSVDSVTGRLQAAPGWDLNIRVPGMQQSEQKASTESDPHLAARVNQQQMLDLRKQVEALTAQLSGKTAKEKGSLEDMTVVELREMASRREVNLGECRTKAEIIAALQREGNVEGA